MEFRALGPLEVVDDGQVLDLGPFKHRSLLALLLIHANEVVSTDRILEALWGPEADGKENALWVYVSRLRSALEPHRSERGESTVLFRRDHGYVLAVDPASYDVGRFEQLVSDGRAMKYSDPAAAAGLLGEALALWRGPAFDEFRYEDFAHSEASRLDEVRVTTAEDRIDADLACGLAGELVSELEVLRERHPLRERFVAHLMLAMYRSGRAADALRAFGRFRREAGEGWASRFLPSCGGWRSGSCSMTKSFNACRSRETIEVEPLSRSSTHSRGCGRSSRRMLPSSSGATPSWLRCSEHSAATPSWRWSERVDRASRASFAPA